MRLCSTFGLSLTRSLARSEISISVAIEVRACDYHMNVSSASDDRALLAVEPCAGKSEREREIGGVSEGRTLLIQHVSYVCNLLRINEFGQ